MLNSFNNKIASFFVKNNKKIKNHCQESEPTALRNIPNHIAIIMDGNQRWAEKNRIATKLGHKAGSDNIENIIKIAIEFKIKYLTLYAFSIENWQRPRNEVGDLIELLNFYLDNKIEQLHRQNIKILVSGNFRYLSPSIIDKIGDAISRTANNNGLTLNIAFSYSGRQEIIDAVNKIINEKLANIENIRISNNQESQDSLEIDEKYFCNNLYQSTIPDPDLMIRTGGYCRISNFLIWQIAYSELYFSDVLWPDFDRQEFIKALDIYQNTKRNYGKRFE